MRSKHFLRNAALVVLMLSSAGCYHATVDTGLQAGTAPKQEIWSNGWLWGLIGPEPVDAPSRCGGQPAARVETQHTFLNGLVAALTSGIYTPITIEITCATGS